MEDKRPLENTKVKESKYVKWFGYPTLSAYKFAALSK